MKKLHRGLSNVEFQHIINNSRYISSKELVLYYAKSDYDVPKFGITAGKKLGNAVKRNKLRRQLREFITNHITEFPKFNYVIIIREAFIGASPEAINKSLTSIINKIQGGK